MTKQIKSEDYTHSVWSGKKYDRPKTTEELVKESLAILRKHPAISKCMVGK